MSDLTEALQIFLKYGNPEHPTFCGYEELGITIDPDLVTEEDKLRLVELGFFISESDGGYFASFRFGSC